MSGICGLWFRDASNGTDDSIRSMVEGLSLDPSDRAERLTDGNAAVAVAARFSTHQIFGDDRVWIVCDADLINDDELRALVAFRSPVPPGSRTAALLGALYQRFGCDFVDKLRGGFSFVLWDRQQRKMMAGIDPFGINRLAYYCDERKLLIGTRVDGLARSGQIDITINPRAIVNVVNFTADLAPATILEKVHRLEPGTMLVASGNNLEVRKYWALRYGVGGASSEQELSHRLEEVVEHSVAVHCSDDSFAHLGAFLSGGTDSSTVVGMMARTGRSPVRTFSIGFQEQAFDELGYARITAEWFKTDHHTYLVGPDDCFTALPEIVRAFDEPYGNSSAVPTYFCARLAAGNGVRLLLAGDGGDELFGGNERYLTDKIFESYQRVPRLLRKGFLEPALALVPFDAGVIGKARRYIRRSNIPRLERFFSYNLLCAEGPSKILQDDFAAALRNYSLLETPRAHYNSALASDGLDRLLHLDMNITLGDNDLPKVTRMCELAGIQARFPFLDRSVAEFSGRIPAALKVKGHQKRYLFKKAFQNLLPPQVIQKKKHGFGIPVAAWLKSDRRLKELSHDVLTSRRSRERGYFKQQYLEELFRANESADSPYYGDMLWVFLMLELWHRQIVDQPVKVAV